MSLVAGVKHGLKRRWLNSIAVRRTRAAFDHDARRYLTHSSSRGPFATRQNLAAKITERYHAIEKGLALPAPRPGFGRTVMPVLVRLVESYIASYGEDETTRAACGALASYLAFNAEHGLDAEQIPHHAQIVALLDGRTANPSGVSGTIDLTRDEVMAAVSGTGLDFFTARHSTRHFDPAPVTDEQLEYAVRVAMTSPAVCNREFGHLTIWGDRQRIDEILEVQGGARGFGHQVPMLAMVTMTLRAYWSEAERNQAWIDGGSFAMAFILGLHAQGLGSVPLNWSKSIATDDRMRKLVGLPDDQVIIMFVGFGSLLDNYRVAASPRRPIEQFWTRGE